MRKCRSNPDTHFTKWNDYPTVQALIGHLISPRRHNALRCCQVNWARDWCAAVGRHRVSRSTWKDSTEVSGQDAALCHLGLRPIWIEKCAWWQSRMEIRVNGGEGLRRQSRKHKAYLSFGYYNHKKYNRIFTFFVISAEIKCDCLLSFSLLWLKMIWFSYL